MVVVSRHRRKDNTTVSEKEELCRLRKPSRSTPDSGRAILLWSVPSPNPEVKPFTSLEKFTSEDLPLPRYPPCFSQSLNASQSSTRGGTPYELIPDLLRRKRSAR